MKKLKTYIDGANIFYAQKKLGWTIDWKKAKLYFDEDGIAEWRYYVGIKEGDEKMRKYLKYLDIIGFNISTKPLKKIKITNDKKLNFIYKANFDVEITADILLEKSDLDKIIIFSGDSDFQYLIKKLKDIGKDVIIVASKKTMSWELKLVASKVVYLEDIKDRIMRK